jgi:hypothetical protein
VTSHMFYRRPLPRDLLDTFSRNDQEMVRHLIGREHYTAAEELGLSFQFFMGAWDLNTQMIDTGIQIQGEAKKITIWLLQYE